MGTMIALLLVLSTLAGCAGGTMKPVRSAPPPPEEPPLLCAVELTSYAETLTDEAGETLAECAYQVPMLRVLTAEGTELEQAASPEEAQALEAAETFNAEFSGWTGHSQKLEDLKETALADRVLRGQESWEFFPYTDELT